jgi:4'-phosphopantetheinyl transferase
MQLSWPSATIPPELAADEAHVWAVPLAADAAAWDALWHILATDEQARADEFYFDDSRRRFVVARGALRVLLGRYLGTRPEDIAIALEDGGKPRLANEHAANGLHFNLSHSGELALIAVALGGEVGVDVEQLREVSNLERIAQRYFHPAEVEDVLNTANDQRNAAFLRCWTAKEAVLKAYGTGITESLDAFRVPLSAGFEGWIDLAALPKLGHGSRQCWLTRLAPCDEYVAAVASMDGERRVRCFAFAPSPTA